MNLFQQLWKNWAERPYISQDFVDQMPWINELNQAVFAQLEKRVPEHVQVRALSAPTFAYEVEDEVIDDDGPRKIRNRLTGMVNTYRLVIPEGKFEDRVELAVELLLGHIDQPGVRTTFMYWPIVPESVELHDGSPNRKYLKVRLLTSPNVAVDAHEGNT